MSVFLIDAGRGPRGVPDQTLFVARELGKKGYPFQLVADPDSDLARKASAEGLPLLALRMRGRMKWLVRRSLAKAMRSNKCRVVHVFDPRTTAVGLAAAAAAEVPLRIISRPVDSPALEGRFPVGAVDAVIAGSEGVKSILVRAGLAEGKIEVVPKGTDFSYLTRAEGEEGFQKKLGFGPADFLVGVVAPLEDGRSLGAVLEAAELIGRTAPAAKLVVLGEGTLRHEPSRDEALPSGENVHFCLGFWSEFPRVLASLDMFVVFSHLDGLGGRLIEAMAAGLPVAATETVSARELITPRETGLLIPPRNAKALADAVLKVYLDKVLASRLAEGGRSAVLERFSVEAMARRIINVYERRAHRKGLKLV